ncbi:MAG: DUF6880 family protein [Sphaerochaeta sp.]
MPDDRKQKLMNLGLETLADLLLDMAGNIEKVNDRINQLVAPALANIQRCRRKIAAIKNNTQFIGYTQIFSFSVLLEEVLEDLKSSVSDPCIGLKLVAEFFETDSTVFENSDDDGIIGDVYLGPAKDLFFAYAYACPEKESVVSLWVQVYIHDEYGARSSLMEHITDSFDTPVITLLQDKLLALIANGQDEKKKQSYVTLLRSVRNQVREAALFEDALQGKQVDLSPLEILKVSQTLLERNEVEGAYAWIRKMPQGTSSHTHEIENILKEIYARQGDFASLIDLHYKNFKANRTLSCFQELLKVTGEGKREEILAQELALITVDPRFESQTAKFLADVGLIEELEAYVFARVEKLDGSSYYSLPDVAEALVKQERYLAASLIYRCLLDSMMEHAYAKSYHHGVDYLNALDKVSPLIKDWKAYPTHNAYKVRLLQTNKRKTSFWNQYLKRKG